MAVISVQDTKDGVSGGVNEKFQRTYRRKLLVITDDPADGVVAVKAALPLELGSTYDRGGTEVDEGAFVRAVDVVPASAADDGMQWDVTVDYGPFDPTEAQPGGGENPLEQPPEYSWSFATYEEPVDEDVDGNPILNSAGDPFDPPLLRPRYIPVMTAVRYEADFSPALAYQYAGKVNSDTFYGAAAGYVLALPVTGRRLFHADLGFYWQVQYEFHFDPRTWTRRVLNQGMRKKVGGDRKTITAGDVPISQPVPLDADGVDIPPSALPGAAVWLEFEVHGSISFADAFNLE